MYLVACILVCCLVVRMCCCVFCCWFVLLLWFGMYYLFCCWMFVAGWLWEGVGMPLFDNGLIFVAIDGCKFWFGGLVLFMCFAV